MMVRLTYVGCAFALGLCFPLCALSFASAGADVPGSGNLIIYAARAHSGQPLYYLIDAAPFLLAFVGFFEGARQARSPAETATLQPEIRPKPATLTRLGRDVEAR